MTIATQPQMPIEEFHRLVPDVYAAVSAFGKAAKAGALDKALVELVQIRASQINGCAYCTGHHIHIARELGVLSQKIDLLPVWREAGVYGEAEIAALAWTEALTKVADGAVPEEVRALAERHFSPVQLAHLTAVVGVINVWNRFGVAFRFFPHREG